MDGGTLYSIGDVARRTGLTVKTIRFYSDCGIVAPADRNPAGHRLYHMDWVELAGLSQDPNFRISMRRMAEDEATEHARSNTRGLYRGFVAFVRDQATPALKTGVDPASARADAIVAALTARYSHVSGSPGNAELLGRLITRLERVNDPRRERYLQLLAVINGWEVPDSLIPALDWSIQAVSARVLR